MKETRVQILDCFAVQDSYGEMVLARIESRAQYVHFGDYDGLQHGRYIVYWTDAPSEKPVQCPQYWFSTSREAREHFETERNYELSHRR